MLKNFICRIFIFWFCLLLSLVVYSNEPDKVTGSLSAASKVQSQASADLQTLLKGQSDFLIEQAYVLIEIERLKTPQANSALGTLEQLKRIDPSNPAVKEIGRAIGDKYLELTRAKIELGLKSLAQEHLDSASSFIQDGLVLADYQSRVHNIGAVTQVTPEETVAATTIAATTIAATTVVGTRKVTNVESPKDKLICDPDVKVAGAPLSGRTFTVTQSLPLTERQILSKSKSSITKNYSNIQDTNDGFTYQQARQAELAPLTFNLSVKPDGKDTMLIMVANIPTGVGVSKSAARKGFCDILSSF